MSLLAYWVIAVSLVYLLQRSRTTITFLVGRAEWHSHFWWGEQSVTLIFGRTNRVALSFSVPQTPDFY